MNQSADIYYSQHMSGPPSQTVTSATMNHYQQPTQYSNAGQYGQYGYTNGLTSPPAAPPVPNPLAQPQNVLPLPGGVPGQNPMQNQYAGFDTTGQQPPPGMKPRVTATLWEDEGSLCFQVEARGICVARREDNHMINGTKLLNVAGMTRGRRDGILKSEKVRHVVKIGPMHLKGVWIPYERALDFANKEKITEMLYPLFVHNIGALLYHPTNQSRTTQVMAAAERRKQEQGQMRNGPPTQGLPSIQQHHHHSMALPGPQPSLLSQANMVRPTLDRAHTFPTPPTSASSVLGSMGASEGFNWQGQGMNGAQATTPPGSSMSSMQSYSSGPQGYDGARQMYSTPASQQSPYQTSTNGNQDRMYAQPGPYPKSEMGPPSSRPAAGGPQGEHHDNKPTNGIMPPEQAPQHQNGDEEADHEHEAEYTHDSGAYDSARTSYNYTAPGVGALTNDGNMPSEMTGSPNHPPASGRATPRTAAPHQPYYPQHGYSTPPRVQSTGSNLYNIMSNDRAPHNGAPGGDVYAPPADMASSMTNGYAPQPPVMNGSTAGMKRGRDVEDDIRPSNDGPGGMGSLDTKRRKTMMESTVSAPPYDALSRPASAIAAPTRR
ncbi:Cell pattern formation-associated protein stuA [Tolypocladium capitatum]|uniref:Cell pattern formation-associated protein stuA n=1 Tax=Tolypocladium capitatum TaxID=45235 RepID=A0A2K3QA95_9HYPO|nr:Cell pattern formation-associated protein stuA [Tolypocladium capitatum]